MKVKPPKYSFNNVLLIDDDDLANFINQKVLESIHFAKSIYVNTSAKSALEFLVNLANISDNGKNLLPEVIFIDLNMPLIDGFQFIEILNKNHNDLVSKCKLVVLTSSVFELDRQKISDISKDIMFLNKPLTKDMLQSVIDAKIAETN